MLRFLTSLVYYLCLGVALGAALHKDYSCASVFLLCCVLINQTRTRDER